jgi:hypothetical protein
MAVSTVRVRLAPSSGAEGSSSSRSRMVARTLSQSVSRIGLPVGSASKSVATPLLAASSESPMGSCFTDPPTMT